MQPLFHPTLVCSLLLLTLCSTLNATPISIGSLTSNDDGSTEVITDSLNGLEWLRWDVLEDLTYEQTKTIISSGGAYQDWEIATDIEAQLFINALVGIPNPCTITNNSGCGFDEYENGLDQTYGRLVGDNYWLDSEYIFNGAAIGYNYAWFESTSTTTDVGHIYTVDYTEFNKPYKIVLKNNNGFSYERSDINSSSGTEPEHPISWLLFRDPAKIATIPEPSSLLLFCAGLLLIGHILTRKHAIRKTPF